MRKLIPTFEQFINESYLDSQPSPEYLKNDFDKMKENGYIAVKLLKSVDGCKEGEEVMTSSSEFGLIDDDGMVTCYTKDGDTLLVIKSDLEVPIEPKKKDEDDEK